MLLLIDNYDSFVHNLARYFRRLGQETCVVRNDRISVGDVREMRPKAIVLSPGPCTPDEAGTSLDIVRDLHAEFPMLGVCLGHQTIAAALGGKVIRAAKPMHGRTSRIFHDGRRLFLDLPNPLTAGRYHSLVVDPALLPGELVTTAWADDVPVMAFAHARLPVFGVQFHPESILTDAGFVLLANFLRLAGRDVTPREQLPTGELVQQRREDPPLPTVPVTF